MTEDIVRLTLAGIAGCVTSLQAHVDAISPEAYQALEHLYDRIHDIQKAVVWGAIHTPVAGADSCQ